MSIKLIYYIFPIFRPAPIPLRYLAQTCRNQIADVLDSSERYKIFVEKLSNICPFMRSSVLRDPVHLEVGLVISPIP